MKRMLILIAWLCAAQVATAQSKTESGSLAVPHGLTSKVRALGERFAPGKERITLAGTVVRGKAAAVGFTAVFEIPRKVRYQESNAKTIVYDGAKTKGSAALSSTDEDLLESLFEDSMDGMLYAIPQASLFRPLMYRARMDDGKAKVYAGPYVDIFELVLPVGSKSVSTTRQKHFYFDSQTELLDRVRYVNGAVRVETRFQNWRKVNDTLVPGSITRVENGVDQVTFTIATADVGPGKPDGAFVNP